jgi:transketolase
MGAILSGMALHGGLIPYGGTFLIFSDYMRPAIRLAALMHLRVIYVFTHDSIGLGEDGPTHQPVEQLSALRAIPNLTVLRPCDASETAEAWRFALNHKKGPVALVLTRQGVPVLDRSVFAPAAGLHQGAYVLAEAAKGKPDLLLMASGSEVHLAIEAAKTLAQKGLSSRVVSMPSWELFDRQSEAYRLGVFPQNVKVRIAIEAGRTQGWWRYVGDEGDVVGIDRFGASAPYKVLYEKFGITSDRVVEKALKLLGK